MRPTKIEYFLAIAKVVATRSTCLRRSVGCVLVDKRGHILSTGYNGVASGQPHCNEHTGYRDDDGRVWEISGYGGETYSYDPLKIVNNLLFGNACAGALSESGTDLDRCGAVHAEVNAVIQCRDPYTIDTCFVTTAPCVSCTKQLMSTSCERIVCIAPYAQSEAAKLLWTSNSSREWVFAENPAEFVPMPHVSR
jgi:dCMP deaminase